MPDTPNKPNTPRKARPKLRDGVMKRGTTWSYVIRVKDPETGISKPKWVGGFPTEDEAKAARDEARVKARRGEYIDRNAITVAEYLDEWIEAHAVEIKPKTLQDYRHLIERHVKPHIGGLRLQAVRPARITKLYRDLVTSGGRNGAGLSPRTVAYVHAVLRKAFGDAVLVDQLLPSNPVERAKRPRTQRPEPGKIWTAAQLRAFLKVAESHRLSAFFHLAAYTGARRGELLNLRWRDVDLDGATIHIKGSAAFVAGQRIEGTTKSGRSRIVSIDAGTVKVLRAHRKRQAAEQLEAGESWKATDDHVFRTAWGDPIHPDTVSSLMSDLIKVHNAPKDGPRPAAPLPHARLHDLRHIHATTLLLAGVPVHVVAARLGHADPSITLRVYAHVINEQLAEAAEVFAKTIGEGAA
ncbi:Site-specific recombinase XerD [Thermomonospora echinospora]|uniref:Site-specific recombinase XerD n=1 Tax=Thermomonospora echinospora TaxID=1992 RepID=A0A1H6ECK6_9ACTN|nr:tyrosine-type recombinase/integrase [Thermomonospora echinospora]SEG94686.1 Site-specific recombinase XerD [Thermomonospora echinospora]